MDQINFVRFVLLGDLTKLKSEKDFYFAYYIWEYHVRKQKEYVGIFLEVYKIKWCHIVTEILKKSGDKWCLFYIIGLRLKSHINTTSMY